MRNRDYITRPHQGGGRTAHDYGHTRFTPPEPPRMGRWRYVIGLFVVMYIAAVVWI